jgi:hypothetical protein
MAAERRDMHFANDPDGLESEIRALYPGCEFCIVGLPDPAGDVAEIPVLCYVPSGGVTITPSELSRRLADRVDRHAIPRIVYRIEPPVHAPLRRDEVRARLLAAFSSGEAS